MLVSRKKAFTLVELLVVISIIALLMAILVPALSKARRQAKDVVCLAQLNQWGLAFKLFSDDHDNKLRFSPQGQGGWIDSDPDMKKLIRYDKMRYCPLATKLITEGGVQPFAVSIVEITGKPAPSSYVLNAWITSDGGNQRPRDRLWTTTLVRNAGEIPVMCDGLYDDGCDLTPYHKDRPPTYEGEATGANDDEMQRACITRHGNGVNITFMDWSARKAGLKELWELQWSQKWFYQLGSNTTDYNPPVWPDWMKKFRDYR